jgi:hypothetical protein
VELGHGGGGHGRGGGELGGHVWRLLCRRRSVQSGVVGVTGVMTDDYGAQGP